jgi:DNA-binding transcriptional MerR regulator
MNQRMKPAEVGRLLGRTADWLRRLERQGRIPAAKRDFSGFRYYDPEDVAHILEILATRRRTPGTGS